MTEGIIQHECIICGHEKNRPSISCQCLCHSRNRIGDNE